MAMHGWMLMIKPIGYQGGGDAEFRMLDLSSSYQLPLSASKAFDMPPGEAELPLED